MEIKDYIELARKMSGEWREERRKKPLSEKQFKEIASAILGAEVLLPLEKELKNKVYRKAGFKKHTLNELCSIIDDAKDLLLLIFATEEDMPHEVIEVKDFLAIAIRKLIEILSGFKDENGELLFGDKAIPKLKEALKVLNKNIYG